MKYEPKPLDISEIELPEELKRLMEVLAEHNHDIWAIGRMKEGWELGPKRDDTKKEHPGLVPYSDLEESEKEYDRRTAEGVLKAIIKLGYKIEKK